MFEELVYPKNEGGSFASNEAGSLARSHELQELLGEVSWMATAGFRKWGNVGKTMAIKP